MIANQIYHDMELIFATCPLMRGLSESERETPHWSKVAFPGGEPWAQALSLSLLRSVLLRTEALSLLTLRYSCGSQPSRHKTSGILSLVSASPSTACEKAPQIDLLLYVDTNLEKADMAILILEKRQTSEQGRLHRIRETS